MKDLNKHVIPLVATKWYDLGLELLETKHERELDTIEKDNKVEGTKTCCRKMFSKWLETQSDSASWDQLIQAVKNIELDSVANDIEQLLPQGEYVSMVIYFAVLVTDSLGCKGPGTTRLVYCKNLNKYQCERIVMHSTILYC